MTREEAIFTLKENVKNACYPMYQEAIDMAIEALSADCDLISRADAIDAVDRIKSTDNWQGAVIALLSALPSAELANLKQEFESADRPTLHLTEEAAIELLQLTGWMQEHDKEIGRPMGEWILDEDADDVKCSACGHLALLRVAMGDVGIQEYSNFCPNCGADMRGDK